MFGLDRYHSVALGFGSRDAGLSDVVSVGAVGNTRQIVNVSAGTLSAISTDAVNGSQLFAANQTVATLNTTVTGFTNGTAGLLVDNNTAAAPGRRGCGYHADLDLLRCCRQRNARPGGTAERQQFLAGGAAGALRYARAAGFAVQINEKNSTWDIYINVKRETIGRRKPRQAFMHALDRQGISDALGYGASKPTGSHSRGPRPLRQGAGCALPLRSSQGEKIAD